MRKAKKRRSATAEDPGLKIIVLKGPRLYAGKILFPKKLVDKHRRPFLKTEKNNLAYSGDLALIRIQVLCDICIPTFNC